MADQVSLEILVEVKDALKRLESFEKEAVSTTKAVEKGFDGLKTVAAAALAFLGINEIKDFFKESIKAASEQEQGLTRLSSAMALTGEFTQGALEDFKSFADQMEDTTKFGDDLVVSQLSIAKSFGLSNDKAKELVKTAGDLASATGESLETAVHQLGITYSGAAGRLGQTIPILRTLTEEQLKNGDAVRILAERFKGSAENEVKTYAGAVLQTKNAYEELQKSIGRTITENPTVIAAVKAVSEVFKQLKIAVDFNQDGIGKFITAAVKALAASVPVVTDIVSILAKTLGFLAEGVGLVFADIIDVAAAFGETIYHVVGPIVSILGKFAATVADIFGGTNNVVSKAVDSFLADFEQAAEETDKAARDTAKSIRTDTEAKAKQFDDFSVGLDKVKSVVDAAAKQVVDSNETAANSANKFKNALGGVGDQATLTAEELKKLREEEKALRAEMDADATDEIGKLSLRYKAQIDKIAELAKKDASFAKEAANYRLQAEETLDKKISKIRADELAKFLEDSKKAAEEARQHIENVASKPIEFQIKRLDIEPLELDGMKDLAATGVGIFSKMLEGAAGAKSLISEAAGSFADALLPGIGPAVTGIIGKLAEGPDAAAGFIREFIKAVPDIMINVVKAMPAVTDAFVDEMVNHGGAAKIAYAITYAMTGIPLAEYWGVRLGKQMGITFGDSLQGPNFGRTVSGWFKDYVFPELKKFGPAVQKAISDIPDAFQRGGDRLRLYFAEIPNKIVAGFINGADYAVRGIVHAFDVADKLQAIGDAVWLPVKETFEGFGTGFQVFKDGVSDLLSFQFPKIDIPTPAWLKPFIDAVNSAKPGGKGGGNGVVSDTYNKAHDFVTGKHAMGLTEVPAGFPNDSYIAGLQSGERVVDADANRDLKDFLKTGNGPVIDLLGQILSAIVGQSGNPIELKMDGRVLARGILDLNTQNARLAR